MKITIYEPEASKIFEGQMFITTKDSVEGREVAILQEADNTPMTKLKSYLRKQLATDEKYLLGADDINQTKYSQGRIRLNQQILDEIEILEGRMERPTA